MKRSVQRGLIFFCCLLIIGPAAPGIGTAESGFDITIENTIETPSKTIEFEGDEYDVDSIAVYEAGKDMPVEVTLPDGDRDLFDLLLYNSDQNIERSKRVRDPTSSESVSFETDGTPPGTYSLNLEVDGSLETVHPVVIPGYELSIDAPDTAAVDDEIEIAVTVTKTELNDDPAGVEVILWTDGHTERLDATADGDDTYTATVSLADFETTDYNIYATATGEETFEGEPEILGIEDGTTLTVTSNDDSDDSQEEPGGAPSGGGQPVQDDPPSDETNESGDTNGSELEAGNETDVSPSGETATTELVDENPDSPGLEVSFENTTTRRLTLANETATGNVTVTDHASPPDGVPAPTGSTVSTVEISVPEPQRNTAATIELVVPAASVDDTDRLTVERYDAENESWRPLETTVAETTETTVTIVAETPGFSLFAVTEPDEESSSSEDSDPADDTSDSSDSNSSTSDDDVITPSEPNGQSEATPEDQPGFGGLLALLALLIAAGGYSLRLRAEKDD